MLSKAPERGLSVSEDASVAEVEGWIAEGRAKLKNIPDVKVVAGQRDVPYLAERMRSLAEKFVRDGDRKAIETLRDYEDRPLEGAYSRGTIWLVAPSLRTKQRALEVLAHEAVGHMAVLQMLETADPALVGKLVDNVQRLDRMGQKYIRELAAAVDKSQPGLDAASRAKEIVAQIAERGDQGKDMGAARSIWQRIMDGIRAFFKLTFDIQLSEQDVVDIVGMAERWAQGDEHVTATINGARESLNIGGLTLASQAANAARESLGIDGNRLMLNGQDIGMAEVLPATRAERGGNGIEVARLYIDPEYQRRGIGGALIDKLFEQHPDAEFIDVYPGGHSEPFWLRQGAESVDAEGYIRITRQSRSARTNPTRGTFNPESANILENRGGVPIRGSQNLTGDIPGMSPQPESGRTEEGELPPGDTSVPQGGREGNALESRAAIIGDSGRTYTPEQQRAFEATGRTVQKLTPKERIAALMQDAGKKMAQGIVDQFAPVKDIDAKAYTLLRLSKGATGAFEALMHHGKLSLRDGAYDADTTGGVLEKVFYPLGKESSDFLYWIAGNRAEKLAAEGRENLFSPADIAAYKSLDNGVTDFDYTLANGKTTRDRTLIYRDALAKFNEFSKNVLDMAEESGLIDGASRSIWESEFYVPFYRVADDQDGGVRGMNVKQGVVRQEAFKKLKGGTDGLNDLLANTLMNWAHLIDASAKNRGAKATLEAAQRMGAARKAIPGEKQTVWFMDGGRKVEYRVEDPYLLTALNGLEYAGLRGPAMNAMSAFKHWLTIGVTASPFFKVRNLIRDSMQAIATSDLTPNPLANVAEGFRLTDRERQEYVSALAGGGLIRFGTMLEGNEASRTRQLIKKGTKDATILDSESKVRAFYDKHLEPAIAAYNELGNRGEEINRMALYDQLIKKGVDHATANLMARDLMDFSMQGAWTSIRFLTQVVPFMNARMQGLYKLGRSAKQDPQRFAAVLGTVTLASLALLAAYSDDDDWKKREDWDRDTYWWFKFGGMAFRIPKPFEIGAMATLAERSAEYLFDNEMTGKRFRARVSQLLSDQLSMNPVPQLVKPIVDIYANRDSFTGRPIETMGMERLEPEYRFRQGTTMVARGVSTAGNTVTGGNFLSPVQIDHLVRGYFSWLGAFVVGGADMAIRSVNDEPTRPARDYWKVATGGMVAEIDSASSRYVTQVYEQAKELEEAYGTWRNLQKEGKHQEAAEYRQDNADKLMRYRSVESVKRKLAAINGNIRMVERSNLDPDKKKARINALRAEQSRYAKALSTRTAR